MELKIRSGFSGFEKGFMLFYEQREDVEVIKNHKRTCSNLICILKRTFWLQCEEWVGVGPE
jgi:hypothetical protein